MGLCFLLENSHSRSYGSKNAKKETIIKRWIIFLGVVFLYFLFFDEDLLRWLLVCEPSSCIRLYLASDLLNRHYLGICSPGFNLQHKLINHFPQAISWSLTNGSRSLDKQHVHQSTNAQREERKAMPLGVNGRSFIETMSKNQKPTSKQTIDGFLGLSQI